MVMTTGFEFAIAAMVLFGTGDVIYKRGMIAGAVPHQFMILQSWVFLSTVIASGLLAGSLVFSAGMLWGCLTGLFMWLGFYNFAMSLRTGSVSVNAPIFRLSFVITAVLAIAVLGEPLTRWKILGGVLAFAAVCLLLAPATAGTAIDRRAARSSLVRVLIATMAVGVGNIIYKYGLRAGATPASLVVAQASVVVAISTGFGFAIDRHFRFSRATMKFAPVTGFLFATGFACLVESLARGEASRMVPVSQMGLAVSAVLGFLFLREPFTLRKGAGLLMAVAALGSFMAG